RRRSLRADGRAPAGLGQPLDPDPRRGGMAGDRAPHAEPRRPPRRGGGAAPTWPRLRRPGRPADARPPRRPPPGPAARPPRPRGPPPPRRGEGRLLRLVGGQTPRPPPPLRKALRERPLLHAPGPTQARDPCRSGLGTSRAS